MSKKTIFEKKEKEPLLNDYQKDILVKFFIFFGAVCLFGIISYFAFLGFRSIYHKYSYNRECLNIAYEEAVYTICDKRSDTHPVYRTDQDGKRHISRYETDYYIYYIDEKLSERRRRHVSSYMYHYGTKVLVRYKNETVIYTAKFPDEYRGDKVLNQQLIEIFVDRIEVL